MIIEEKLILKNIGSIMNMKLNKMDDAILSAAMQISHYAMQIISEYSKLNNDKDPYKFERESIMEAKHFKEKFVASYFDFNLLFGSKEGSFALCAKLT